MGPAAGISFAVLRINRATLRLDPRVGPPSPSPLGPPASRLPRSTFPSTFSYPLCAAPRIPTFAIRPCYVDVGVVVDVVIVVVFVFVVNFVFFVFATAAAVVVIVVVDVTQTLHLRRTRVLVFREKYARYRELSSAELISIYLASGLSLFSFLFRHASLREKYTKRDERENDARTHARTQHARTHGRAHARTHV